MMEVEKWELTPEDELFPEALREEGASKVERLYGIGDPKALEGACLSVIGARRATPYGLAIARIAGRVAAESEITVVSGGAMGCDYAASRAALDAGGRTVIVAGNGADRIYPASSADVFREAVARGGAVVSMERWGTSPTRFTFPKRNIVIAALSPVLLVCEAGERSGTMSTCDAALEMDRTIYAAPGSIFSPESQGTNRLVRDGAIPVTSDAELETQLAMDYGILRMASESDPGEVEELIRSLIAMPARAEELAAHLGQSVFDVMRTLMEYETRGIVEHLPDGRYSLTASSYQAYRSGGLSREGAGVD